MSQREQNTEAEHRAINARVHTRGNVLARHGIGRQSGHLVRFCPEHAEARGIGVVTPDLTFTPLPIFAPGEEVTSPNGDRWTVVRHTGPGRVHCERVGLDGFAREWREDDLEAVHSTRWFLGEGEAREAAPALTRESVREGLKYFTGIDWASAGSRASEAFRASAYRALVEAALPQEAERPTHVVMLAKSAAPARYRDLIPGRVYRITDHRNEWDWLTVIDDANERCDIYANHCRPATPEEVALGHCSHVVVTAKVPFFTEGKVYESHGPDGDCLMVFDDAPRPSYLSPGEWRPATLEEMSL